MRKNRNPLLMVLLLLITSSCSCLRWNGESPKGLISQKKADELEENYKNNQFRFINQAVRNDSIIIGQETVFKNKFTMQSLRLFEKNYNPRQDSVNSIFLTDRSKKYPKLSKEVQEKINRIDSIYKTDRKISNKDFNTLVELVQKQTNSYEDTRAVWFSFNEIVGYLTMVQKHADSLGYENLGVRFYYGSYIKNGKPETTLIFVPTYRDHSGIQLYSYSFNVSGQIELLEPNNPLFQQNMQNIEYLNYGGSRRPVKELDSIN